MSGKLTKEELDTAVTRVYELKITQKSKAEIQDDFERIAHQTATRERFWASVWSLYNINEREIIGNYIKMKRNLEQLHEVMQSKLSTSQQRLKLNDQQMTVITDIGELLKVDNVILNSMHVLWILRAIHFLRRKRKETSQSSNSSPFLHGFFLATLIQTILIAESNQPIEIVHSALEQLRNDLKSWFDKSKNFFDEISISRNECTLNILARYEPSYIQWWRRYVSIILDLARTEVAVLQEKMHHDQTKYRVSLGLDYFTPEKRGPIEAYLAQLEQQQSAASVPVRIHLPQQSTFTIAVSEGAARTFFADTSFGGFVYT
jgi:hypothetical protein